MAINLSLVIPTYNEADNITELCCKLIKVLSGLPSNFEIIIIDDDSPDLTWKVAEELAKQEARIKVIRRIRARGLAQAVLSGWKNSQGDILGVMDADLQHPPEVLEVMFNKIISNPEVDIVVASRYVTGGGFLNRNPWQIFRSRLAIFLGKIFVPRIFKLVKDPLSGYFLLHRRVIEVKQLVPIGYKILFEVLAKGSYRNVLEVPYYQAERKKGKSKADWRQYLLSLIHFNRLRQV
ncbi:MAG: glycosyltransferase [Candidatus Omnitrophica bacterium]|nr:glycosyltransferase [Candidatus Omnitrophota bacterium]